MSRELDIRSKSKDSLLVRKYEKFYVHKDYTPVDSAFPLMQKQLAQELDVSYFGGSSTPPRSVPQPHNAHTLRISVLGAPNAGKSSLVNAICHSLVSAEGRREGTTMRCVHGVASVHNTQLCFVDTPGILLPSSTRKKAPPQMHATVEQKYKRSEMFRAAHLAWDTLQSCQLAMYVQPVGLGYLPADDKTMLLDVNRRSQRCGIPFVLVISQIDRIRRPLHKEHYFALRSEILGLDLKDVKTLETSAVSGAGVTDLKDYLCLQAKPGVWDYHAHEASSLPQPKRMEELMRHAMFRVLPGSVPHVIKLGIVGWTRQRSGSIEVGVEAFFCNPTIMKLFLSNLGSLSTVLRQLSSREFEGQQFSFQFVPFLSPQSFHYSP